MPSNITTSLTPDSPVALSANYQITAADRRRIDDQIVGMQRHLAQGLLRGQTRSNYKLSASSVSLAKGDLFCVAQVEVDETDANAAVRTVTRADATALAAAGVVLGVAATPASPGSTFQGITAGIVGRAITGLAQGASGAVRATTARCERVASLSGSDFAVGFVDSVGNLTLSVAAAGAAVGGGASLATVAPPAVGTANVLGSSVKAAKEDHAHDHGSQTSPTHHATATTSAHGFMHKDDKAAHDVNTTYVAGRDPVVIYASEPNGSGVVLKPSTVTDQTENIATFFAYLATLSASGGCVVNFKTGTYKGFDNTVVPQFCTINGHGSTFVRMASAGCGDVLRQDAPLNIGQPSESKIFDVTLKVEAVNDTMPRWQPGQTYVDGTIVRAANWRPALRGSCNLTFTTQRSMSGTPNLTFSGNTVTRSAGGWAADGYAVGDRVIFAKTGGANNGLIGIVTAIGGGDTVLTLTAGATAEGPTSGYTSLAYAKIVRSSGSWIDDGFNLVTAAAITGTTSNNSASIAVNTGLTDDTVMVMATLAANEGPVAASVTTGAYVIGNETSLLEPTSHCLKLISHSGVTGANLPIGELAPLEQLPAIQYRGTAAVDHQGKVRCLVGGIIGGTPTPAKFAWSKNGTFAGQGVNLTFNGAARTVTRASGSWVTEGYTIGETVAVLGTGSNLIVGTLSNVTSTVLTFAAGPSIVNEGPTSTCFVYHAYVTTYDPRGCTYTVPEIGSVSDPLKIFFPCRQASEYTTGLEYYPIPRIEVIGAPPTATTLVDIITDTSGALGTAKVRIGWGKAAVADKYLGGNRVTFGSATSTTGGSAYYDIAIAGTSMTVRVHAGVYSAVGGGTSTTYFTPSQHYSTRVGSRITDGSYIWEVQPPSCGARLTAMGNTTYEKVNFDGGNFGPVVDQAENVTFRDCNFTRACGAGIFLTNDGTISPGASGGYTNTVRIEGRCVFTTEAYGIVHDGGYVFQCAGCITFQKCQRGSVFMTGATCAQIGPGVYCETGGMIVRDTRCFSGVAGSFGFSQLSMQNVLWFGASQSRQSIDILGNCAGLRASATIFTGTYGIRGLANVDDVHIDPTCGNNTAGGVVVDGPARTRGVTIREGVIESMPHATGYALVPMSTAGYSANNLVWPNTNAQKGIAIVSTGMITGLNTIYGFYPGKNGQKVRIYATTLGAILEIRHASGSAVSSSWQIKTRSGQTVYVKPPSAGGLVAWVELERIDGFWYLVDYSEAYHQSQAGTAALTAGVATVLAYMTSSVVITSLSSTVMRNDISTRKYIAHPNDRVNGAPGAGSFKIRAVSTTAMQGAPNVTFSTSNTATRSVGDYTADGFANGDWVVISGATQAANNIIAQITGLTTTVMSFGAVGFANEGPVSGITIWKLNTADTSTIAWAAQDPT